MAEEKKEEKKGGAARQRQPSAVKRALQSEAKRLHNRQYRSRITSAVKKFEDLVAVPDQKEAAKDQLNFIYSLLDKAVKTKLFKLNKVSRLKTRLTQRV